MRSRIRELYLLREGVVPLLSLASKRVYCPCVSMYVYCVFCILTFQRHQTGWLRLAWWLQTDRAVLNVVVCCCWKEDRSVNIWTGSFIPLYAMGLWQTKDVLREKKPPWENTTYASSRLETSMHLDPDWSFSKLLSLSVSGRVGVRYSIHQQSIGQLDMVVLMHHKTCFSWNPKNVTTVRRHGLASAFRCPDLFCSQS